MTNEPEIDISSIDFSDLEKKYTVEDDGSYMDKFIIVDGAPIAPESKVPILTKVLKKLFSAVGELQEDSIHMPLEDGKTKGYLFIGYKTAEGASEAVKKLHGKKLDQQHRLLVNKFSDMDEYLTDFNDEFKEPATYKLPSTKVLDSWLLDEQARDQFSLEMGNIAGVYWYKHGFPPTPVVEPRVNWTELFTKFSPKGSYFLSVHKLGIHAWGGDDFKSIHKFYHPGVRLIDFSPDENYLVTLSPEPITLPAKNHPARASFPFKQEDVGNKLVIWDFQTGLPCRTFALPPDLEKEKKMTWPLVKWSYDSKYCARKGPDAIAVYEAPSFQLVNKKLLRAPGVAEFEWAPAGVRTETQKKGEEPEHLLAYWSPEQINLPAKVAVVQVPTNSIVRTVNLTNVTDCKLYWHDNGSYLCCKVDRHTRSKKTIFSYLEFFKVTKKDIPVIKLELKEAVTAFAWEPTSERFGIITTDDVQGTTPNKMNVSFYAPEISKGKVNTETVWRPFRTIGGKNSNAIVFSPKGRFVVAATLNAGSGDLDFYDLDFEGERNENDTKFKVKASFKQLAHHGYHGITHLQWEDSGRFVAGWSSVWKHTSDNGFKIYNFAGILQIEDQVEAFKKFSWRARPESILTEEDKKKVEENLEQYSAQFEELDSMEADANLREIIMRRKKLLKEWKEYRGFVEAHLKELGLYEEEKKEDVEVIEEVREEILEEKEEIVD
ncbi:BA75_03845T0 [Komagataella pastoris]|uniref:Eukaryotic translation initiation factor 3 subunit B n=1 Tax=Komagataella pastoris TaxID=4922 RepID=A0A1B2JF96_PICPA|nr:BA75_03845T0 [Komagataella pastoris]